jgi:hypothetical protein
LNAPTGVRAPETMTTSSTRASRNCFCCGVIQNAANASYGKLRQIRLLYQQVRAHNLHRVMLRVLKWDWTGEEQ